MPHAARLWFVPEFPGACRLPLYNVSRGSFPAAFLQKNTSCGMPQEVFWFSFFYRHIGCTYSDGICATVPLTRACSARKTAR